MEKHKRVKELIDELRILETLKLKELQLQQLRQLLKDRAKKRLIQSLARNEGLLSSVFASLTHSRLVTTLLWIKLKVKEMSFVKYRCIMDELQSRHSPVDFYKEGESLENSDIQRHTFAHSHALNNARSELTISAFNLHQTWVKDTWNAGLYSNVYMFKDCIKGNITEKEGALAVWQSFFMLVPVVSSTFASFGNQFKDFGTNEIGWLFIDEAGQAAPQQAVGALLRSKRAVTVGDPLQIEPVFTIPPKFVNRLGRQIVSEKAEEWLPSQKSVQNLADRVNPYGTEIISSGNWLGSPLRVHRRCKEPMFTIANRIAYNEKMYHGEENPSVTKPFFWEYSKWIDIKGNTVKGQYVSEQGEIVLKMIQTYWYKYNCMPDVYVISPFRKVSICLKKLLREKGTSLLTKTSLEQWMKA